MKKITEKMTISEILEMDEKFEVILEKNFMPCVGCLGASAETLKEATDGHGIDLEKLLKELNDAI